MLTWINKTLYLNISDSMSLNTIDASEGIHVCMYMYEQGVTFYMYLTKSGDVDGEITIAEKSFQHSKSHRLPHRFSFFLSILNSSSIS
jgi:hypothetical protein